MQGEGCCRHIPAQTGTTRTRSLKSIVPMPPPATDTEDGAVARATVPRSGGGCGTTPTVFAAPSQTAGLRQYISPGPASHKSTYGLSSSAVGTAPSRCCRAGFLVCLRSLLFPSGVGKVELLALQDQWYQDVAPDNLAELLRKGIVWKDSDTGHEWLLSGREVFALAHGTTHRGFVTCPRLVLRRNHVVLCTVTQLGPVESALRAAGCANWTQLGEGDGVPSGWRLLRGVVPHKSLPLSSDADILNILRPLPEIEIALEGGIRLAYNTWLLGYPPAIHVYGDSPTHRDGTDRRPRDGFYPNRMLTRLRCWDVEGRTSGKVQQHQEELLPGAQRCKLGLLASIFLRH